jgi:hypothetical protein
MEQESIDRTKERAEEASAKNVTHIKKRPKKIITGDNISIESDNDLIFVTVAKYKLFFSYGEVGLDAYLLYSHLMFTARTQKTNSVWANNTYLRGGLHWGKDRLNKAKNLLFDLGLINQVEKRGEGGKFEGHYIEVATKKSPFEFKADILTSDLQDRQWL